MSLVSGHRWPCDMRVFANCRGMSSDDCSCWGRWIALRHILVRMSCRRMMISLVAYCTRQGFVVNVQLGTR